MGNLTTATPENRSAVVAALRNRCPRCGEGRLLDGFLTPAPRCESCGADFAPHDAGDGAVFLVMTLLCFLAIGVVAALEFTVRPPVWAHLLVGGGFVAVMTALLLPLAKRFVIAQSLSKSAGQVGAAAPAPDPTPPAGDQRSTARPRS